MTTKINNAQHIEEAGHRIKKAMLDLIPNNLTFHIELEDKSYEEIFAKLLKEKPISRRYPVIYTTESGVKFSITPKDNER